MKDKNEGEVGMNENFYPDGIDFVWLSVDRNKLLGVFVTGGDGPIPLLLAKQNDETTFDTEEILLTLPDIAEAKMMIQIKRPDSFIALAQKGLFVFDWRDVHRVSDFSKCYELVSKPTRPLCKDDISNFDEKFKHCVQLNSVSFDSDRTIDPVGSLSWVEKTR